MLTDAELKALESRLAPALAEGGRGVLDRQDVLDLLAETRALRPFVPAALAALEHVFWVFECLDSFRAEAGSDERLVRKLRGHLWQARGAMLEALQVRPAGAVADHEAGDRALDRIFQDRAELERLREPLEVAGLLPAGEVKAVLDRLGYNWPGTSDSASCRAAWRADVSALLTHTDAQAALVRELYAVVADLGEDLAGRDGGAYGRGRAEALEQVTRGLEAALRLDDGAAAELASVPYLKLRQLAAWVRSLGPCRPPLPPCEAERLLRDLLEAVGRVTVPLDPGTGVWFEPVQAAFTAAKEALGEDAG